MFILKLAAGGRDYFLTLNNREFSINRSEARTFMTREYVNNLAKEMPGTRVAPLETRPALYRVRLGSQHYLAGSVDAPVFQVGKLDSLAFNREDALVMARDYEGAIIVPAV